MDLYSYVKYFILGGIIMVGTNYLLDKYHNGPALIAYLYCAPTIYLIIMYIIYQTRGINGYYTFIVHSFINYIANTAIIVFLIFLTKYLSNAYKSFFIVSILFIFYSIYYFLYIYKLEFTPL
jgi:hypothetical protein